MTPRFEPAPDEHTALIQKVSIGPARRRYSHQRVRWACSFVLAWSLAAVVLLFLLPDIFTSSRLPWTRRGLAGGSPRSRLSHADLLEVVSSTPSEERLREWSRYYTSGPHLAGKNLSQAMWTRDRWREFGISDVKIVQYDVYLNYPLGHRLALLEREDSAVGEDTAARSWHVKYEASLEEDALEEDGTSALQERIPTFHGYSASGNVTASYVYVNYGTYEDFADLESANISLAGKIALARYGRNFRGLKVKRAQELGMVGVVIYDDPEDDGETTIKAGVKPYPDGFARQPSSVQRGSVQYLNPHACTPNIPSLPISYEDAIPLLKALNGHGPAASSISEYWKHSGLDYRGVEYHVGPSPDHLALNLVNQQNYTITPIWNVIGIIKGSLSDETVILGNHRDAWIAGGAGDPNSGSSALLEVARAFGRGVIAGWTPLRTIVLASWDGEEYGLLGSTEWVEDYLPWLAKTAVAYLNVDVGTAGSHFTAAASPILNSVLYNATSQVRSPNQTVEGQTVRQTWDGEIRTMGSGSDFTAFQDFAGVPCVDLGFKRAPGGAVYHYHSNYDSFDWMEKYGDPGWKYHVTIARLWALLAVHLIETAVIPFNATAYADALKQYLRDATNPSALHAASSPPPVSFNRSLALLTTALERVYTHSFALDAHASAVAAGLRHDVPWWRWWERLRLLYAAKQVNEKYKLLERQFLYAKGLDGRTWFKHVVFAPGLWTGYSGATFPGLVENVQRADWANAERWSDIIRERLEAATKLLSS
ncbi:MAG: hypothetical protein M1826_000192 [Phylliscum demangeonii]|nr:MAG: hypothetical protein M1826_000192 [Phylliscum demangeonii]